MNIRYFILYLTIISFIVYAEEPPVPSQVEKQEAKSYSEQIYDWFGSVQEYFSGPEETLSPEEEKKEYLRKLHEKKLLRSHLKAHELDIEKWAKKFGTELKKLDAYVDKKHAIKVKIRRNEMAWKDFEKDLDKLKRSKTKLEKKWLVFKDTVNEFEKDIVGWEDKIDDYNEEIELFNKETAEYKYMFRNNDPTGSMYRSLASWSKKLENKKARLEAGWKNKYADRKKDNLSTLDELETKEKSHKLEDERLQKVASTLMKNEIDLKNRERKNEEDKILIKEKMKQLSLRKKDLDQISKSLEKLRIESGIPKQVIK